MALALALWLQRGDIEARERQRLVQQTGIVHDNLARQLKAINAVLARLAQDDPLPQPADAQGLRRLNTRLLAFSDALAGVRTLNVLDQEGVVVASSRRELLGQNAGFRDYFRAARAARSSQALVVSAPFLAMQDGGWYMTLARVAVRPGGGFGGVVMATLDPEQFSTLLDSVRYEPDMVVGLTHGDGLRFLLASETSEPQAANLAQPGTLFTRHLHGAAPLSVLSGALLPEGPHYLGALRTIAPPELHMDKPLVVTAARRTDALLQDWRDAAAALAYTLAGLAGAAVLALMLARRRDALSHQRTLAEKEAQLEARWRMVLQATSQGVWEWRADTRQAYFSPAWSSLLGIAAHEDDDALEQWRERLHPDDRARVWADVMHHAKGETSEYDNVHRVRKGDGSYIWVRGRGRVIERDASGRALRFLGSYEDVTEQRRQQLKLDHLAEHVPGMLCQFQLDPDGHSHFPYASAGAQDIYACTPAQLRADASAAWARVHPEDVQPMRESVQRAAQTLELWRHEYRVLHPERGERWISGQARAQRLQDGATLWHGFLHDVTDAKHQAMQLQETERLLKHLMNEMPIGLCMADGAGRIYYRNRRFLEYFGYDEQEVPTLAEWWPRAYPDAGYREQVLASWERALAQVTQTGGEIEQREYRTAARDGTLRTMAIGGLTFGDHFLGTFVDRTEQQAQSELLRKLAYVDSLTCVANRRHFDQALAAEWRRCRRSHKPLALVLFDIDHFKQYNDLYGHQAGDACLRAVAGALRAGLARSHDVVARYGGEEFVCLLPECDAAGALAKAEALCRAVQALGIAHRGSATAPVVTVSGGVAALVPGGEHTPEDLLACADRQLYQAKVAGRNRVADGPHVLLNG